ETDLDEDQRRGDPRQRPDPAARGAGEAQRGPTDEAEHHERERPVGHVQMDHRVHIRRPERAAAEGEIDADQPGAGVPHGRAEQDLYVDGDRGAPERRGRHSDLRLGDREHDGEGEEQHARRRVTTTSATVQSPTVVAIRRCVCSTATLPTILGIALPKQVGQSGQASPESVLVTTPPATMRTTVRKAAAAARRRITAERLLKKRRGRPLLAGPPASGNGRMLQAWKGAMPLPFPYRRT